MRSHRRAPDRLTAAGFVEIETSLQPEPAGFEAGERLETFLRTVIFGGQLARLPDTERDAFVHDVAARLAER